jgi:hypothetical protein
MNGKTSSLSILARAIRSKLAEELELDDSQIVIGPPHEAAKQQENAADKDHLCVFFYRMGYSGFPADAVSDDPLYLNAFCLITALGGRSGGKTPGDSELNLIGSVLELFHRNPVIKVKGDNNSVMQLQVVPTQLSLDDINHLWVTQNNTPYRLSLSYEFALLPVPMGLRAERAPRAGAISVASAMLPAEFDPLADRRFFQLQVPVVQVDVKRPGWAPHICLLDDAGSPVYSLMLKNRPEEVSLIALGAPGEDLKLEWEIWDPENRNWQKDVDGGSCRPAAVSLPGDLSPASLAPLAVKVRIPAGLGGKGQALLRATRSFAQEGRPPLTLAGNPVLITVNDRL